MNTVWKYPLWQIVPSEFELDMPDNALILHFSVQSGQACLWAKVDTEQQLVRRRFRLVETGAPLPDQNWSWYRGTVLLHDGLYVLHLFELMNQK